MTTITLQDDYNYDAYRVNGLADGTIIDASGATWIQDNDSSDGASSPYPFRVDNAPSATLKGGTIEGNIDQTSAWRSVYDLGNSAAIRTEDSPGVVISDWRISNTWDAIRVSWGSDDFLIEDVWVTDARDDAVENDRLLSGTIRDSLFDGVYAGLSIDPSSSSPVDGHEETVRMEGVLLRLQTSLYKGEMTHGSPIKTDSATNGEVTPNLVFIDNVFAIETVDHRSYRSMFDAWANTVESRGNFFLNLSDEPLPDDYPMPPEGWTVLQGQEARDYWENARDEWVARHDAEGTAAPESDPAPVEEDSSQPADDASPTPNEGESEQPQDSADPAPVEEETGQSGDDSSQAPSEGEGDQPQDNADPAPVEEEAGPSGDDSSQAPSEVEGDQPEGTADQAPTFFGFEYEGSKGADTIFGNAMANWIDGDNGDDVIHGGDGDDTLRGDDGTDILWGGLGNDTFFFKRLSDSRDSRGIDEIADFSDGDLIDLSRIDANRGQSGDQAFSLSNGSGPGTLTINYDEERDETVVSGNVDTDGKMELSIVLRGEALLSESDFIL